MNHLDKVPCARWATVQITVFSRALSLFSSRSAGSLTTTRRKCLKDWIEMANDLGLAADHLAVAALHAPDAAAGANIDVVYSF